MAINVVSCLCPDPSLLHPKTNPGTMLSFVLSGVGKGLVTTRADLLCIKVSRGTSVITALVIEKNVATKLEKAY